MFNKNLVNAIKDYILEGENKEELVFELRRYKRDFRNEPDYNYYRYGNILPYYSQIRDFMSKLGIGCPDDNEVMCVYFCRHVGRAIDLILCE